MQDAAGFKGFNALKFSSVTPEGIDVYELKQANATWYFDIYLDPKGQIIVFDPWVRRDGPWAQKMDRLG